MHRPIYFAILFIFIIFGFIACKQETEKQSTPSTLVVEDSAIVFFYPDSILDDSLKKSLGIEKYYALRDSLTRFNFEWHKWAESLHLKQLVTEARGIEFKLPKGIFYRIEPSRFDQPWGIILFRYPQNPQIVNHPPEYEQVDHLMKPLPPKLYGHKKQIEHAQPLSADNSNSRQRLSDSLSLLKRLSARMIQIFHPPREFTFEGPSAKAAFYGKVIPQKVVIAFVDNDVFLGTDMWYTNGANISWINPSWQYNPLSFMLHPVMGRSFDYYGLLIRQNFYTPIYNTYEDIQYNDRPFASYLYLGEFKVSNFPVSRMRITTEFDAGVLGPSSLGQEVQTFIHSSKKKPVGWKHQILDDIVLEYQAEIEKSLFFVPNHDITIEGRLQAGTLYNKLSAGFAYRYARFDRRYGNDLPQRNKTAQWKDFKKGAQLDFFAKVEGTTVFYDATLQGGMFNHSSPYTIKEKDVERYVLMGSAGISTMFKGISLGANFYILSPEFAQQKRWHKWGRITLSIAY
jgi:hypothetical protein